MISRRNFLKLGALAGAGVAAARLNFVRALAAQSPQQPLAPTAIPQFVDPVPALDAIVADTDQIELLMTEFQAQVLPTGMPKTWVWGYLQPGQSDRASYLGPVIVATRGQPTEIKYVNNLGSADSTKVLAYKYGTDQTLHWADPLNGEANMWNHMSMPPAPGSEGAENYLGPIPACVHLHGGEVPAQLDGGPDAWFTSDGSMVGHAFYSKDGNAPKNYSIYRYPNSQPATPAWFHDHTLGATRLNVYCGLAGGYFLLDPDNDPPNLPSLVPLVIQDRMFDTDGQLLFPSESLAGLQWAPNPEHPYWVPEFVGDVICVNGKAWPYLDVTARRYTFYFINGSNARSYELSLTDPVSKNPGPPLWVIGTEGGYLDKPVKIDPLAAANNKLTMMPGERYLVVIDFKDYQPFMMGPNRVPYSGRWLFKNTAKVPYPNGATTSGTTTGRVMEFRVAAGNVSDSSFNPAVPGATLRGGAGQGPAIVRLVNPATGKVAAGATIHKTRQLTLNEVMGMPISATNPVTGLTTAYPGGPLEILVNNTKWSGERVVGVSDGTDGRMAGEYIMEPIPGFTPRDNGNGEFTYYSETPTEGETEIWEIVNLTVDAHPIHTHLAMFQLMNRQAFDVPKYTAAYDAAFPGGGHDHMTGQPYPAGMYIPGFGPPSNYNPAAPGGKYGGNPDVGALSGRKPLFLKGPVKPPLPQEAGWKDTVITFPGEVTRIVVRWGPTDLPVNTPPADATYPFDPDGGDGYVWHCHIVDHEDNEMMRPSAIVPQPAAPRTFLPGDDF